MKRDYDFDITYFYQDKLSEEVKTKRTLQDREKEITVFLDEINENIDKLNSNMMLVESNELLVKALNSLLLKKANAEEELRAVEAEKLSIGSKKFVK